ncbi:MAG TPA: YetF domain-containing protein [Pyrinomonadaceae bacterium]|nr:YetF domain-containing protein [Pyrinomonadaceae bacterium]
MLPELWNSKVLPDMFSLSLSVGEKMLRPVIVYLFLVIALRIFGKRELAQLNPFDLIVLLSLSNTVQNAIIGDDNSVTGGLVGAFALLLINYLVVRFLFKHRRLDQFIEGKPTILIENGLLRKKEMAKELLTESELLTVVHRQGFSGLKDVEKCVIEPGGIFYLQGKEPPLSEQRYNEISKALGEIRSLMEEIKKEKSGDK